MEDRIATPVIVLCSQYPFVDPYKTTFLSLEEYESYTVDLYEIISQIYLGHAHSVEGDKDYKVFVIIIVSKNKQL